MKLYFVRHGQTYLNKYKNMQGWSDTPLTPEGEAVLWKHGNAFVIYHSMQFIRAI